MGIIGHENAVDVRQAATLAADELLGGAFDEDVLIRMIATNLNELPLACSTHDLAAFVALTALKSVSPPNGKDELARMTLLEWYREGKLRRTSAHAFDTTYQLDRSAPL